MTNKQLVYGAIITIVLVLAYVIIGGLLKWPAGADWDWIKKARGDDVVTPPPGDLPPSPGSIPRSRGKRTGVAMEEVDPTYAEGTVFVDGRAFERFSTATTRLLAEERIYRRSIGMPPVVRPLGSIEELEKADQIFNASDTTDYQKYMLVSAESQNALSQRMIANQQANNRLVGFLAQSALEEQIEKLESKISKTKADGGNVNQLELRLVSKKQAWEELTGQSYDTPLVEPAVTDPAPAAADPAPASGDD